MWLNTLSLSALEFPEAVSQLPGGCRCYFQGYHWIYRTSWHHPDRLCMCPDRWWSHAFAQNHKVRGKKSEVCSRLVLTAKWQIQPAKIKCGERFGVNYSHFTKGTSAFICYFLDNWISSQWLCLKAYRPRELFCSAWKWIGFHAQKSAAAPYIRLPVMGSSDLTQTSALDLTVITQMAALYPPCLQKGPYRIGYTWNDIPAVLPWGQQLFHLE